MWWKWIIQIAVATGADKWAGKKASQLIEKLWNKLIQRTEDLGKVVPLEGKALEIAEMVKEEK